MCLELFMPEKFPARRLLRNWEGENQVNKAPYSSMEWWHPTAQPPHPAAGEGVTRPHPLFPRGSTLFLGSKSNYF